MKRNSSGNGEIINPLWCGLSSIPLKELFSRRDPLLKSRREFKFIVPIKFLPEVLQFLKDDFYYAVHGKGGIFDYQTMYFDTVDNKFFNWHRQGKYNRIKVRVRKYKSGEVTSFIECKRKVRGLSTKKERLKIEKIDKNVLDHNFIHKYLKEYGLTISDLKKKASISYKRIFMVSRNFKNRITIDFDITAENGEKKVEIVPGHFILEIKEQGFPKEIMKFLRSSYKIRETGFSKYCVAVCLLDPEARKNKWKQVLKKYHTYGENN